MKITSYLNLLSEYGIKIGEPYVKYLGNKLWELRPLKNRIIFFFFEGNTIILLHIFIKKTRKTPTKELEIAKSRMNKIIGRKNEK